MGKIEGTKHSGKVDIASIPARFFVKYPYLAMMGLFLGAFVGTFGETAMNVALPELSGAFGVDTALMQWMIIGYMLVIGLVLPFAGILMKRIPARRLTVFALVVFIASSLVSAFAGNFPVLLIGRMIQGVGTGLILPVMFALVVEIFPPAKIGSAMGVCALIMMFAPAIGPTLSGLIVGFLSWRWLFIVCALVLCVAFVFALIFAVSPYELTKPRLDKPSCVTTIIGFGDLVTGVGFASLFGWVSVPVLIILAIGIISLILFARRQFKLEEPLLNLRAFSIPDFRIGAILVMLTFGITLSSMFLLPQYIQNSLLLPVALTGLMLLPGGVVNAVIALFAGRLFDKRGARIPVTCGIFIALVGIFLMFTLRTDSAIPRVMISQIVIMIGVAFLLSPSQSLALSSLPKQLSADGSGIMNTMQQVWGAVSTAVATSFLGIGRAAFHGGSSSGAYANGFRFGLFYTLALAVIGAVVVVSFVLKARPVAAKSPGDQNRPGF